MPRSRSTIQVSEGARQEAMEQAYAQSSAAPVEVGIDVQGLKEALDALTKATDAAAQAVVMGYAAEIQNQLARYPPPRPGQRYIRGYGMPGGKSSEMLGRRWSITPSPAGGTFFGSGSGFKPAGAVLKNSASYASFVHDPNEQAWMHRGRWMTVDEAARAAEQSADLEKLAQDAIDKVAGGRSGGGGSFGSGLVGRFMAGFNLGQRIISWFGW